MATRRNGRAPARRTIRNNAGFTVNSIIIARGSNLESLTNGREYLVTSITETTVKIRGFNRSYANRHFVISAPAPATPASMNSKFTMFLPKGSNRPYDFRVSVYQTSGLLKISAGCFAGTLAQAQARTNGSSQPPAVKTEYRRTLTQIEIVARSLGILIEAPKPVTVTLTPEEAVTLRTIIHQGVTGPTSSSRRHLSTIGSKLLAQNVKPSAQRLFKGEINFIK